MMTIVSHYVARLLPKLSEAILRTSMLVAVGVIASNQFMSAYTSTDPDAFSLASFGFNILFIVVAYIIGEVFYNFTWGLNKDNKPHKSDSSR